MTKDEMISKILEVYPSKKYEAKLRQRTEASIHSQYTRMLSAGQFNKKRSVK